MRLKTKSAKVSRSNRSRQQPPRVSAGPAPGPVVCPGKCGTGWSLVHRRGSAHSGKCHSEGRKPSHAPIERARTPAPRPASVGGLAEVSWPSDPLLGVDRRRALGLSVVANSHDMIVGITSQLSVRRYRGDEEIDPGTILTEPDPDEPWATTRWVDCR